MNKREMAKTFKTMESVRGVRGPGMGVVRWSGQVVACSVSPNALTRRSISAGVLMKGGAS